MAKHPAKTVGNSFSPQTLIAIDNSINTEPYTSAAKIEFKVR
jgi:hypothetical protein